MTLICMCFILAGYPCQVGATGFCQGGVLSFIAAQHAGIAAAAPFYGFPQVILNRRVGEECVENLQVATLLLAHTSTIGPAASLIAPIAMQKPESKMICQVEKIKVLLLMQTLIVTG